MSYQLSAVILSATEVILNAINRRVSFLFLIAFGSLLSVSTFADVDYVTEEEVASIKERIFVEKDPEFISMYNQLIKAADKYLAKSNPSIVFNDSDDPHVYQTESAYCGWFSFWGLLGNGCRDGQYNPDANRKDYEKAIRMSKEGVTLALAYRLSGDNRYADKWLSMLNTWMVATKTHMAPRFNGGSSRIEIPITHLGIIYATNLIRYYPGWQPQQRLAVVDWFTKLGQSAEEWQGRNNFEEWRIALRLAIYSLTDNKVAFASAINDFTARLNHINEEGFIPIELKRTRSLGYSLYAVNAMLQSAEIAHLNGVDLYHLKNSKGVGLFELIEAVQPYSMKTAPKTWPHQQIAPLLEKDVAIFELAYKRYGKKSYAELIRDWGRPLTETRTYQWISLSHGQRLPTIDRAEIVPTPALP